ncbi:MAG: DUF4402 domain-containing protein [Balneolaceae bacterium]|nr:DUF4402 domain-containing protein [Balneolaceae bacterium]
MKRLLLLIPALLLVIAEGIFAQSTQGSATINAAAEVVSTINATEIQGVDFAVIEQDFTTNGDPTIDPSDGSTTGSFVNTSPSITVGFIEVVGTGGQTVSVTVPGNITLSNTDNITFTPNYNYTLENLSAGATSWTAAGTNTTSNFTMTLDGPSNNDDGTNTILVGGSLSESVSGALTDGSYTGNASVTIDYQ